MTNVRLAVALAFAAIPLAHAQEPAEAPPRFDDERLFTTAPQREHLDALREGTPPPERPTETRRETPVPPDDAVPEKKPPAVAVQGFIRRSDGRSAVWANGQSTLQGDALDDGINVDSGRIEGNSVVITLPDGRKVRLEPGQVWDPEAERVVDAYRQ